MSEPLANDWKAIHDRMKQIKAEPSSPSQCCPRCRDHGWVQKYLGAQHAYMLGVDVCNLCHNPQDLRRPERQSNRGNHVIRNLSFIVRNQNA